MFFIVLFIKGFVLGITAIIPGVSIGTMALVLDLYEKCIEHVVVLFNFYNWRNKTRCKNALLFLFPLVFGTLMSMFIVSKLLLTLFEQYRIFLQFVFFGMICASIPHLFQSYIVPLYRGKTWLQFFLCCAIGFVLMYFLSDNIETPSQNERVVFSLVQAFKAFIYGTISATVAVVPGISGSYVLLLMGYYETFLHIMSTPVLPLLVFFLMGSIVGFIMISLIIRFLFHTFPATSYAIILGIITSSVLRIVSLEHVTLLTTGQLLIALACVFCGVLFVTVVTAFQNKHAQTRTMT